MVAAPGPRLLALAMALWPAGLGAQPRLQEAGGGLRAPGDSVTLSCHGSGFNFGIHGIYGTVSPPEASQGGCLSSTTRAVATTKLFVSFSKRGDSTGGLDYLHWCLVILTLSPSTPSAETSSASHRRTFLEGQCLKAFLKASLHLPGRLCSSADAAASVPSPSRRSPECPHALRRRGRGGCVGAGRGAGAAPARRGRAGAARARLRSAPVRLPRGRGRQRWWPRRGRGCWPWPWPCGRQSVQGRAKMSRDNSRSEVYLSLLTLQPHDSVRYLCAFHTGTGNPAGL
ncbi:uncharacterized protein LOC119696469 [Motacilla alba alba]|uniref:uncharacterized protein LOC119696469 n=1 Tax=Motacilla alba alba TaxID=1094192 RepID=UPI0018D51CD9|nr:uncharacterized protein LOC119696469 [Motacilla alba alba]